MDKRPLKVFLCHASTDKPKVRELYRYLKRRGINPWFDEEDLVGGQDWQVEIPKALATSDAIIICLTKNSVDKEGYIQKEIKFALDKALEMPEGRIFLIPIKLEDCEVPFSLSRYQWVDLTVESGYAKMMKALKFRASQLERSTVEVSKRDVDEGNLAREKAEKEKKDRIPPAGLVSSSDSKNFDAINLNSNSVIKQSDFEKPPLVEKKQDEKEFLEKQAREGREKAKRVTEKKEEKPATIKPKTGGQIAYWFGGFIVLILGIVFLSTLNSPSFAEQPTSANTQTQAIATSSQNVVQPSVTATLKSPTETRTSPPSITSTVTQVVNTLGTTKVSPKDEAIMVFIPASEGVDAFWAYQKAVSNSMFSQFVEDTDYVTDAEKSGVGYVWTSLGELPATQFPGQTGIAFEWQLKSGVNWKNPPVYNGYTGDEVLQVSWNDAVAYCKWAEKELLTEVEWQKAKDLDVSMVFYVNNNIFNNETSLLGEWGSDKTTGIYRVVLGRDEVKWGGYTTYLFQERGFAENRSANRLTFRCKE